MHSWSLSDFFGCHCLSTFNMNKAAILVVSGFLKFVAASINCSNSFEPISAETWVNGVNPGWNLGNTLDATPTEGSWNNPPVDFSTFDVVKSSGFKGVRLPGLYMPKQKP